MDHNSGDRRSPAATLAWQGQYFHVPPLEPSQRWSLPADLSPIAGSAVPDLLRTRTTDRTAVLLGLTPEQIPAPGAGVVNAWLLLRPAVAEQRT